MLWIHELLLGKEAVLALVYQVFLDALFAIVLYDILGSPESPAYELAPKDPRTPKIR